MRVVVTGPATFLGRAVVDRLTARGDEVTALDAPGALARADAVVHTAPAAVLAAPLAPRRLLGRTAVATTDRVLAAARDAGVDRVVVVTGTAVFGDTGGRTVDEAERADRRTRIAAVDVLQRAHARAVAAAARQPVVLALPGLLHGDGDPGPIGLLVRQVAAGGPVPILPAFGATLTHRDDAAAGVLRVLDAGRDGRAYVLGGEPATLGRVVRTVAALAGQPVPRPLPPAALRVAGPLAPALAAAGGLPAALPGLLRALDGRTCYARDTRARRELAHTSRSLEAGLRATLAPAPPAPPTPG